MVSSSTARFTIEVDGIPKTLLSFRPSAKGDLYMVLKTAAEFRANSSDFPASKDAKRIVEQRYSIHPSMLMPTKNAIKQTLIVENQPPIISHHHTKAIKGDNRFALIFSRRAPDLRVERYNAPVSEKNTSVNCYEPAHFTLFYAVLVAAKGQDFSVPEAGLVPMLNITQQDIGDYRIVIISAFANLPSTPYGMLSHFVTLPPDQNTSDEIRNASRQYEEGLAPYQAMILIGDVFMRMGNEFLNELSLIFGDEFSDIVKNFDFDFYPEGRRGTFPHLRISIRNTNLIYTRSFQSP